MSKNVPDDINERAHFRDHANQNAGVLGNALDHVRHTLTLPFPQLRQVAPAEPARTVCLVGGGASRERYWEHLQQAKQQNYEIWALDGAYAWLVERGIEPEVHVLSSPDYQVADDVPEQTDAILLYASQCHPEVFLRASLASSKIVVWHPMIDGITTLPDFGESVLVDGGSTTEMLAIRLAFNIGCRTLHLFGYDSSYEDETDVDRDPDDGSVQPDQKIYVQVDDKRFVSSMRLAKQIGEFHFLLKNLIPQGLGVNMHGEGLLPSAMQKLIAKQNQS